MTDNFKSMSVFDIFGGVQETYEDAKRKSSEETRKKTAYLRFTQDGTYAIRILPLAPVAGEDGQMTLPRKGYEYPTKEIVLKINTGKDAKGKDKVSYVNVTNAKYQFPELAEDLIDLYARLACEMYADDEELVKKIKSGSFNGGLKYDSKRCMYVYDMDKRGDGIQILQLSFAQYKDVEERKIDLWAKRLKKDPKTPCPISSFANAHPLEIKRKTDKKTEYTFNIDTESDFDVLTEDELQTLLDMPRLPEVIYRYTRYHLEATIAYLKQYDEQMQIEVMSTPEIKETIEKISLLLPADDHSHFNPAGNGASAETDGGIEALWNMYDEIEKNGLDDKSEEGLELRASIKEFIEANELDVVITRKTSNYDLLVAIEDAMEDNKPNTKAKVEEPEEEEDEEPATPARRRVVEEEEDDEDEEPADPSPRRTRNEDTNEPAARPRRGARPARRG